MTSRKLWHFRICAAAMSIHSRRQTGDPRHPATRVPCQVYRQPGYEIPCLSSGADLPLFHSLFHLIVVITSIDFTYQEAGAVQED